MLSLLLESDNEGETTQVQHLRDKYIYRRLHIHIGGGGGRGNSGDGAVIMYICIYVYTYTDIHT